MHEMGIVLEIMEIALASIPEGLPDARVETVNVQVGRLSAVVPESLRFCFGIARRNTALSGATLNIEEVPIVAACDDCGARTTIEDARFVCSACGGGRVRIASGRELTVLSIELAGGGAPA